MDISTKESPSPLANVVFAALTFENVDADHHIILLAQVQKTIRNYYKALDYGWPTLDDAIINARQAYTYY